MAPTKTVSIRARAIPIFCPLALGIVLLSGCASISHSGLFGDRRLDVLTDFAIAVQQSDFSKAMNMLTPEEQAKFLNSDGNIRPDLEEKLRALNPDKLNNHPFIRIEDGKIRGLFEILPSARSPAPRASKQTAVASMGVGKKSKPRFDAWNPGEPDNLLKTN